MSARVSPRTDIVHFVTRGVNLKSTGNTTIVSPLRTTQKFVVTGIWIHATTATSVTVNPTLDIHVNGGSGNVVASAALTNDIRTTDQVVNLPLVTPILAGSISTGGAGIVMNISVGATATTLTGDVHVLGYYI